jgi:hypothetical protein
MISSSLPNQQNQQTPSLSAINNQAARPDASFLIAAAGDSFWSPIIDPITNWLANVIVVPVVGGVTYAATATGQALGHALAPFAQKIKNLTPEQIERFKRELGEEYLINGGGFINTSATAPGRRLTVDEIKQQAALFQKIVPQALQRATNPAPKPSGFNKCSAQSLSPSDKESLQTISLNLQSSLIGIVQNTPIESLKKLNRPQLALMIAKTLLESTYKTIATNPGVVAKGIQNLHRAICNQNASNLSREISKAPLNNKGELVIGALKIKLPSQLKSAWNNYGPARL